MSISYFAYVTGVIGLFLVHSIMPQHWLPFVIVGRERQWSMSKTMGYLSIGALAHCMSTVFVGLIVGYFGKELDSRFEAFHGIIPGVVLTAFGAGFVVSSLEHRFHNLKKGLSPWFLVLMLAVSPCFVVAPFFMMMGPLGFWAVFEASLLMSAVSMFAMIGMGWLFARGLMVMKFEWLEKNESRIMGSLLIVMGLLFMVL